jgi:hypothetical protein
VIGIAILATALVLVVMSRSASAPAASAPAVHPPAHSEFDADDASDLMPATRLV